MDTPDADPRLFRLGPDGNLVAGGLSALKRKLLCSLRSRLPDAGVEGVSDDDLLAEIASLIKAQSAQRS